MSIYDINGAGTNDSVTLFFNWVGEVKHKKTNVESVNFIFQNIQSTVQNVKVALGPTFRSCELKTNVVHEIGFESFRHDPKDYIFPDSVVCTRGVRVTVGQIKNLVVNVSLFTKSSMLPKKYNETQVEIRIESAPKFEVGGTYYLFMASDGGSIRAKMLEKEGAAKINTNP